MKKIFLILFVFILLVSCASPKPEVDHPKVIKKIEQAALPGWAYQLPSAGNYVIGIAARSIYEDQMKDAAKQMAAVGLSRSKSSYTISKSAATTAEEFLTGGSASFKLIVSSSPQETERIYQNLELIDEEFYYGFYLALFSEKKTVLSENYKMRHVASFPDWYENDGLKIENNTIYSYASESSSDLITAWKKAAEKAQFEIGNYLEKEVQSILLSENDNVTTKIAIETRLKLTKMEVERSYITSELNDNLRSYKVYLEMVGR